MKPVATEILAEQRSEGWYSARLGRATASRFADITNTIKNGYGATRKNYLAELVIERLTGQQFETYQNAAMLHGIETEELARTTYMLKTGNIVTECGFFAHNEIMAGASPDGLVGDDGTIEVKSPNPATHIETLHAGTVPAKYVPQIYGQLWMTGRQWCDFISFDDRLPENAQIFITRVERDDKYIAW
ncbi:MAG TPA: YqaJ viral recombinase family protein, partial [Ktedonobacteraceae bacterium]|nr:YqaJ viral recombinase family protein [Ktedonobacteraceae bacterium]